MADAANNFGIGAAVRRLEDDRLLRGRGSYTDDLVLKGQLYAAFLRSPHAFAKIRGIATDAARAQAGVVAVFTGADLPRNALVGPDPAPQLVSRAGKEIYNPVHPVLAGDVVRYVGEPVAVVIAETADQARVAAEAIETDYEPLEAVANPLRALTDDAPVIWSEHGSNVALEWDNSDSAEVEARLATASHRVRVEIVNNRVAPAPIEPRSALATYDKKDGRLTLYAPTQGGRRIQDMVARYLELPVEKVRVVSGDTGGSFGIRTKFYPELAALVFAAHQLKRPVKWRGDRLETFVSDYHGRDQVNRAEMGLSQDGRIVALKVETIANLGAYLSEMGARIVVGGGGRIIPCGYDIDSFHFAVKPVFTNTVPTDSYRGAGRPEANFLMEALMDAAARTCGLTRDEIRRRNLVPASKMPYRTQMGLVIDTGDFRGTMEKALKAADWKGFGKRRKESKKRGKLRGIGLACFVEPAGGRPFEEMKLALHPDGTAEIFAGTYSHGQGHETVYAQLVHEYLGLPLDRVRFTQGDTDVIPQGAVGSFGSRSSMMGGTALKRACDALLERGKVVAAHLLQSEPDRIHFSKGRFSSASGSGVDLFDVVKAARDPALKLDAGPNFSASYRFDRDPDVFNYPNGCHICEIEIDAELGSIEIVGYTAVDDCGVVLNPMIVHGQLHGGVAQGLGQAFIEDVQYEEHTGQLLSASFMDYGMPRAVDIPDIAALFSNIPSSTNDLGVKGAGEAGVCGAPHALVSAAVDALSEFGVVQLDMPLTSQKIWRAIRAAKPH